MVVGLTFKDCKDSEYYNLWAFSNGGIRELLKDKKFYELINKSVEELSLSNKAYILSCIRNEYIKHCTKFVVVFIFRDCLAVDFFNDIIKLEDKVVYYDFKKMKAYKK